MSSISSPKDKSIILEFINGRIISKNFNEEIPKTISIVKPILIALGITISAFGKVPFISISLRLKKFGTFRYFLAASNAVGFWILGSWSSKNIINEVFQTLVPEERILLKNQLNCLSKTTSIVTGFLLSVSSQAVIAYLAYTYNNENILMPIAIMLSDTSFPFYSTLLSSKKVLEGHSCSKIYKKFNNMKQEIVTLISDNLNLFIAMKRDQKVEYLKNWNRIRRIASKKERMNEFLSTILQKNPIEKKGKVEKFGKVFFGLNGAHLTCSHMILLGIISYVGGFLLTSSKIGGIAASSITIISNIYLEGTSLVKTAQRVFTGVYNFFTCKKDLTLSEQLSPKFTFTLKTLGLLISFFSWGPSVQVSHDYIENVGFRTYMQIASASAVVLLISTAMLDIIDDIMNLKIRRDSKESKAILEINNKMKRLIRVIEKSSLDEFLKFIQILPEETIQQIAKKCKISPTELDVHLKGKKIAINNQETTPLLV